MDPVLHKKTFFDAVGKVSVKDLETFVTTHGMEVAVHLVNSSNETGQTPLLLAVRGNNEKMVELLSVKFNTPISKIRRFMWKGLDYEAIPPCFIVLVCSSKIIPSIVRFLIVRNPFYTSPIFINNIISSNNTLQQKIEILELVGAAYILESLADGKQNNLTELGLACWKQAILLRHSEPFVPKDGIDGVQIKQFF